MMISKQLVSAVVGSAAIGLGALAVGSVVPVGALEDPPAEASSDEAGPGRILGSALDALVEDGTLTQAQADAVRAEVAERVGARPDGHGPRRRVIAASFETSAEVIGVEVDDLRRAVAAGQTVGEVATANGVDPQTVVDALVVAGESAVDEAVADGRIDDARGEAIKARLPELARRFVDHRRAE
jgi:hypothetical protein